MTTGYSLDEELWALQNYAHARRQWAEVGLILPEDPTSDLVIAGSVIPALGRAGMSAADVWAECLEDARGVLAHAAICRDTACECRGPR